MNMSSKRFIFGAALLAGIGLALAGPVYDRLTRLPPAKVKPLNGDIAVSEQLKPQELPELRERGFRTIIDLRPDGEAIGQASSAEMHQAASATGMQFSYVPVPHGQIPDSAVAALDKALANSSGPVLLYCRSGKRAARTWGLVEASRSSGMDGKAILTAIRASGQSADDLSEDIARRIAQRAPAPEAR